MKPEKKNLLNIDFGNAFGGKTPKEQSTKAKLSIWDYIKLKSS